MKKSLIALAMLTCAVMAAENAQAQCYSEGVRVGSIQKFSQKGFITRSWEGEIVMEGTKMTGNADKFRGGNVWAFSVLDDGVAKVIEEAVMTGGSVALKYCQANPLNPAAKLETDTLYRVTQAVLRK